MSRWKITVNLREQDLYFTVSNFKEREGRILFIDEITGLAKNFPYDKCFIEEVKKND